MADKHDKRLLPCPFCGDRPIIEPWHGGPRTKRRVGCDNGECHVAPDVCGNTPAQAIKRWNTRADAMIAGKRKRETRNG